MRYLATLFLLAAGAAMAQPLEHFFQLPRYTAMTISPDGQSIAALSPVNGRQNVVVIDLKTNGIKAVTSVGTRDIVQVQWVNSKRLLARTGSLAVQASESRGGSLYAVDRDGEDGRLVSEGGAGEQVSAGVRMVYRFLRVVRILPGETDDIIAQERIAAVDGSKSGDLFRVNTRTGRRTPISLGKPDSGRSESWVVDAKGVARAFTAADQGRARIWYRVGEDAPWRKLDEYSLTKPGWAPIAVDEDDKSLIVTGGPGRDKAAIMRYHPDTGKFGDVLAEHPQVDLRDVVFSQGVPVGVRYDADRPGYAWFDAEFARIQRDVDAAFPDRVNQLSWSRDRSQFVVLSHSDTSPGSFYLFDTKAKKMQWLLDRAPWIKPEEMAPMRPVRYSARDGLSIPAYLTLPRKESHKNLPLLVVVHGGPWVDGDSWRFNPQTQFLASRGYAVLQPNFRGTTRYGWKHFSSSFGQWGLAMQDDIADGVKWAVEQGIADPKRVCIYGASYGGYATMMGLAKHPELYRCGVNYVGVTDMNLFLTATWSDYAYSDFIQHSAKEMVGDASRDAERLKATSPVELGANIKAPVLMAYGGADFRVPIEHGTRMKSALERHGNKPVWIVAEGEGHGFRDPKNLKMYYEAVERFLKLHLGS